MIKHLRFLASLLLLAVASVAWGETVTLKYSGSTTTNMTGENDAVTLGLSETEWSVVGGQGSASNMPGLNKAGDIRLYYHADGGNTLTVTSLTGATINSINITFTGSTYSNASVLVEGNAVTGNNGTYGINSSGFVIGNANTSNVQVRISQIEITYTTGGSTTTVATPTFTPAAGTYTSAQDVTISTATEDATVYYTTDGTDPTTSSSVYSTPVEVTKSGTTIKAIAVKDGLENSTVASATYTIQPNQPTITIEGASVTITAEDGLTVYYTTNGDNPTTESNQYTSSFSLTEDCTIKAIAVDQYGNTSRYATANYAASIYAKNIGSNYYVKVTSLDQIEAGDAVIIVNEETHYALSTTQNSNNRGQQLIPAASEGVIDLSEQANTVINGTQRLTLVGQPDAWYFYTGEDGYLYAASSSNNYLRTGTKSDNAKAEIGVDANNNASIVFQGSNTRNVLRYNSGSSCFSCYESASQKPVQLYVEVVKPSQVAPGLSVDDVTLEENSEKVITVTTQSNGALTFTPAHENIATVEVSGTTYTVIGHQVGSTTITVSQAETENYTAAETTFTVTVTEKGVLLYESFNQMDGTGGNDGSWSGTIANSTFENTDLDGWTVENAYGASHCAKFGTGTKLGKATTPAIVGLNGNALLTFKAGAWNNDATTLKLSISGSGDLSKSSVTMANNAWTEYSVYIIGGSSDTKITFEGNSSSNSRFFLDEVKVVESDVEVISVPEFSLSSGSYIGEQTVAITCATEGTAIYYTTNGSDPTEESTVYEDPITVSETMTLKAIAVKGESKSDIATATYTILITEGTGTQDDPYTVADANLVADMKLEGVYVKGFISEISEVSTYDAETDTGYGNASYYISDDGTTGAQFYIYRGFYLDGEKFTSEDQIKVGDEVVVYGNMTVYNSVKEFAQGNHIVSLDRPEPITFDEEAKNASDFAAVYDANVGENKNVQMLREFGYDYWNTLVVPFDLTRAQLEEAFGKGVLVAKYTGFKTPANIKFEKTTGDVTRADLLLVKPTATVTNPIFKGVTLEAGKAYTYPDISSSWADGTLFNIAGRFAKQVLTDSDYYGKVYFLNKQGKFTHPTAEGNVIRGFRWFIQLKTPDSTGAKVTLDLDGEATSIEAIDNGEQAGGKQEIFNLAGQRVQKAQKGIYIMNGKKVVVK